MPAPRPPFLRRPASAPYFHPLFLIFQTPLPSGGGNQNLLPPAFKKAWWGPNYDVAPYPAQKMKFSIKDFFSKCEQIRRKLHFFPSARILYAQYKVISCPVKQYCFFWLHIVFYDFMVFILCFIAQYYFMLRLVKKICVLWFNGVSNDSYFTI